MRGIQQTFENGASPFSRWVLSPVLILTVIFLSTVVLPDVLSEGRVIGLIVIAAIGLACIAGLLALWGVPYAGRIVTGVVASGYAAYVYSECFVEFEGDWGFGKSRGDTTPINSILGFIVFGLPCAIYTILGRFSLRAEPKFEDDEISKEPSVEQE